MSVNELDVERTGADRGSSPAFAGLILRRSSLVNRRAGRHTQVFGIVAATALVFIVLFCFAGPFFYHTNQTGTNLTAVNLAPSLAHPLGTDDVGRDILGRLMVGGQSSIEIGIAVAVIAVVGGALWGALAGWFGGALDSIMMRLVDLLVALPPLFILIFIGSVRPPSAEELVWVIAALSWPSPARLVRAEVLSLKRREFVDAVQSFGGSAPWVVVRHLLPNTLGTMIVNATFQVADAVLVLATLSFLGLGLPPPSTSWGGMLSSGTNFVFSGFWWEIYPAGIIIVVTVVCINLLGDTLRERVDGRLRAR